MNGRSPAARVSIASTSRRAAAALCLANVRRGAEQSRVQKVEQAPQLAEMVLDRRAAQREPMLAAQQPRGLGPGGCGVLDGLRLVEDRVLELDVLQLQRIAPQRSVGREHEVVPVEPVDRPRAAAEVEDAELRRESRRLLLPVEDDAIAARRPARCATRRSARSRSSQASTMTVLPSPMSSARHPPKPNRRRNANQPSASR